MGRKRRNRKKVRLRAGSNHPALRVMQLFKAKDTKKQIAEEKARLISVSEKLASFNKEVELAKKRAEMEKKSLSDEMDTLFHRIDALRREKSRMEQEREELLKTDWAVEIENKLAKAEQLMEESEKRLKLANNIQKEAEEAQSRSETTVIAYLEKEAALDRLRDELKLARESMERDMNRFIEEKKQNDQMIETLTSELREKDKLADDKIFGADMEMASAKAMRDEAMELMKKIEQEKKIIESRQHQIKAAIIEAKRLGAKGV